MAQKQSDAARDAKAILIARREKAVSRLATIYSSKAVADLISISKAIEILEQLERPKAGPSGNAQSPPQNSNGGG
ncbi:hypothetical protein [Bradyrhizobium sp. th.b2]|uniref:hypothetical protein n=1 Tax=Bradyrhizobium sp. th-b2 TaxID=172088 RepID=UPI00048DC753|nr:hypothetical protein [Bradyrhizobium sp. th.b2]